MNYIYWLLIAVCGGITYHICQKLLVKDLNPMIFLACAYFLTFLISVISSYLPFFLDSRGKGFFESLGLLTHKIALLSVVIMAAIVAIALVFIEVGVLMSYRTGGQISKIAVINYVCIAVVLFLVSLLFFSEPFSWFKLVGLVVCLGGLFIMQFFEKEIKMKRDPDYQEKKIFLS